LPSELDEATNTLLKTGVAVGVAETVGVGVAVEVRVGVADRVGVAVAVAVRVGVAVADAVGVDVEVLEGVGVAVAVAVRVGVAVADAVGVDVGVLEGVDVAVADRVGVDVVVLEGVGVAVAVGVGAIVGVGVGPREPAPWSFTCCGLLAAASVKVINPSLNLPTPGGLNAADTWHEAPAESTPGHPLEVSMNPDPLTATDSASRLPLLLLVNVTVRGAVMVTSGTVPKLIVLGAICVLGSLAESGDTATSVASSSSSSAVSRASE
jgi:hypothetical protein